MPTTSHPFAELVSLIESASEPQVLLDPHYRILAANAAYRAQFDASGSVVGRHCYEISHHISIPCDQAGESCPLSLSSTSGRRERLMHLHHTPAGEEYVSIEVAPIRNAEGDLVCFVESMETLPVARGMRSARGLVGRSRAFREMLDLVARVARSEASVLLQGESGTGKELVANALHRASNRSKAPFITVDCSGIPETLFESELFGHERGAFTGAVTRHAGLIAAADGGTLFLDEVGDIPLSMQVKLLRLLETGSFRSVGSTELRHADIRVISATHRNLRDMVRDRLFRADLFYRLNTFPIQVPPLRERISDIPLLVETLLARVMPGRQLTLHPDALAVLRHYAFPGNVRELRNLLERASLMCDYDVIEPCHLPHEVFEEATPEPSDGEAETDLRALAASHKGSRKALARILGISERTLYRRLKSLE